ncbi:unnamed protein product [Withania somnifera]
MATFSGIFVASAIVFSYSALFSSAIGITAYGALFSSLHQTLLLNSSSSQGQGWRKSNDNLNKDKTCQINAVTMRYKPSNNNFTWTIEKDVPTATCFQRAYAYGQTTDVHKKTYLFKITSITGRHVSIDVCASCFSAFSLICVVGFYFVEKRKTKISGRK